jgi:seryl-tRNA(Sec) selenium transferase
MACNRLEKLTERLNKLDSKSKKRRYTRRIQKFIEEKFTEQLKKLTKTEGQILVKLMYRQTGITTFDLVKDLKSGWRAFWYNSTASLFNISLKEKYDPYSVKEDYLIEDILQRSFRDGKLDKQAPAIDLDYLDIVEAWISKD